MEKLIYVSRQPAVQAEAQLERLGDQVVSAARRVGGQRMAVLVPDQTEATRARCAERIVGDFDSLDFIFECWLPCLDDRGGVEEALRAIGGELWGYLVTESIVVPCPHDVADGERVPGITQFSINDKPPGVPLEDFYREWQEVHSKLSFDLHPHRESYARNAVARRLTPDAPSYLAIVLERFPSLEHFTDESLYFGDPAVVQQMYQHAPSFYAFETAIAGGLSEFRFT